MIKIVTLLLFQDKSQLQVRISNCSLKLQTLRQVTDLNVDSVNKSENSEIISGELGWQANVTGLPDGIVLQFTHTHTHVQTDTQTSCCSGDVDVKSRYLGLVTDDRAAKRWERDCVGLC